MSQELAKKINNSFKNFNTHNRINKNFKYMPCFIFGLPRSGSTLLHQILITAFDFNYVSNIKGFFYKNVLLGSLLHNQFIKNTKFKSNFISEFGNTSGPFEPNEWGWFWRKWLNLKNDEHHISRKVDWNSLKKELLVIESTNSSPLLFDTPFINGNLDKFVKNIGPIIIFSLERSNAAIFKSLLNARLKKYGTLKKYYGAKTKEKKIQRIKDPFLQVFQQVTKLQEEKKEMLKLVSGNLIIKIHYENLVNQPIREMEKIQTFLKKNKIKMNLKNFKLPKFQNRNNNSFGLPILKKEFKRYYKKLENDARENSN